MRRAWLTRLLTQLCLTKSLVRHDTHWIWAWALENEPLARGICIPVEISRLALHANNYLSWDSLKHYVADSKVELHRLHVLERGGSIFFLTCVLESLFFYKCPWSSYLELLQRSIFPHMHPIALLICARRQWGHCLSVDQSAVAAFGLPCPFRMQPVQRFLLDFILLLLLILDLCLLLLIHGVELALPRWQPFYEETSWRSCSGNFTLRLVTCKDKMFLITWSRHKFGRFRSQRSRHIFLC